MTLATWITLTRFLLAPLIFWQMTTQTPDGLIRALVMLAISAISDLLDGWAARARHEITELGKTLDPLGDKLVIFLTLLSLTWWGLPGWLVAIYIAKEAIQVLAGFMLLRKFKQLISANVWGKSSTFCFFAGFGIFFIHRLYGFIIIGLAVFISIYALYTYYQAYLQLKRNKL